MHVTCITVILQAALDWAYFIVSPLYLQTCVSCKRVVGERAVQYIY
jgi:hypothetical protein